MFSKTAAAAACTTPTDPQACTHTHDRHEHVRAAAVPAFQSRYTRSKGCKQWRRAILHWPSSAAADQHCEVVLTILYLLSVNLWRANCSRIFLKCTALASSCAFNTYRAGGNTTFSATRGSTNDYCWLCSLTGGNPHSSWPLLWLW